MSNAEPGADTEVIQLRARIAELTIERNRWKEQCINEAKCRDIAATNGYAAQRQVNLVRLVGLDLERQAEDAKRRRTHTSSGNLKSKFRHLEIAYRETAADIREALESGQALALDPPAAETPRELATG